MDLQLAGRYAIITGAARGIGREIAAVFLEEGGSVVLLDIDGERLSKTAAELRSTYQSTVVALQCDITNSPALATLFSEIGARHGFDYLVNNAGISEPSPIEETSAESWQRVMDINLNAAFFASRAAFTQMKARGGGVIINIGSFAGKRGTLFGNNASYATSKAGIIGLTKALVLEGAKVGVRVAAVCPGVVETDMLKAHSEEARKKLAAMIPLGRFATPREIANVVVFLCSPAASHITGVALDVNGGLYLD